MNNKVVGNLNNNQGNVQTNNMSAQINSAYSQSNINSAYGNNQVLTNQPALNKNQIITDFSNNQTNNKKNVKLIRYKYKVKDTECKII